MAKLAPGSRSTVEKRRNSEAAARARDGHGRRIHGFSTARAVSKRPVKWLKKFLTGRHGQRHGRNGYTGITERIKKVDGETNLKVRHHFRQLPVLPQLDCSLQVWRQEVSEHTEGMLNVQTRAVPVPLSSGKNGRRNGHGTRATGAVEPWPRSRAAALLVKR
ncbi:hypothetical protein DFH09DRAFT_1078672 [Mycena vulgaris]|nr:hypothetical protein DFH09DRAFT_1078672 [Mycena vulgaris]